MENPIHQLMRYLDQEGIPYEKDDMEVLAKICDEEVALSIIGRSVAILDEKGCPMEIRSLDSLKGSLSAEDYDRLKKIPMQ